MKYEHYEIDGFKIVVTFHDKDSDLLQEAKHNGKALIGTYSVKKHPPHVPGLKNTKSILTVRILSSFINLTFQSSSQN